MHTKPRLLEHLIRHDGRLQRRIAALDRTGGRYATARLLLVAVGGTLTYLAAQWGSEAGWTVGGLFLLAFGVTAYFHRQVDASLKKHQVWLHLKRTHQARMTHDWAQVPASPVPATAPGHPFATDLNLIGPHSLHQLLNVAVTQDGAGRLRDWLLAPVPDPEALADRQARVRELRGRALFRDKLILAATLATPKADGPWNSRAVHTWLDRPSTGASLRPHVVGLALWGAVNLGLCILAVQGTVPWLWPQLGLVGYAGLYLRKFRALGASFFDALSLETTLEQLYGVVRFLETYRYGTCRHLAALCRPFLDPTDRPSTHLRRLRGLTSALSLKQNPLVGVLLNLFFPWDLFFIHRLDQEKAVLRRLLPAWLDVWFELEALNGLATYAALNPATVFPEIAAAEAVFSAEGLGHPLLPDAQKVANDFAVPGEGHLALVTGSNMSGKSTFLRTLGINLALAYAGGTVDARHLTTSLFRVFTCINVSDSVTDGLSYFYAEVKRLKALLEALDAPHPYPLFFLIDEIFRGTNNRERLIGSRSFLRALVGRHGVGAISTHDLELVHLADALPTLTNYHFRETVVDGRMHFDYRLHPGPCPTTNALVIMRMEGLPVDDEP